MRTKKQAGTGPSRRQTPKKIEGGPFGGKKSKMSRTMPKKTERAPFSLARYCMIRGKNYTNEKPLWFSSLKIGRTFGRTIWVTSGVSEKTLTKSHDYSRLFSQEKH